MNDTQQSEAARMNGTCPSACSHSEQLRALLEGLECEQIDALIENATPERCREIGQMIAAYAKAGARGK
jgi:hypothetical protein